MKVVEETTVDWGAPDEEGGAGTAGGCCKISGTASECGPPPCGISGSSVGGGTCTLGGGTEVLTSELSRDGFRDCRKAETGDMEPCEEGAWAPASGGGCDRLGGGTDMSMDGGNI